MHEFRPDFVFIFLSAKIFTAFVTSFFQAVKKSKEMSMSYQKRLDQAFKNVPVLPLDDNHKYVVFSDCHRGSGNNNDNFIKNEHLYLAALRHYNRMQYTYVELGDGDELWSRFWKCTTGHLSSLRYFTGMTDYIWYTVIMIW